MKQQKEELSHQLEEMITMHRKKREEVENAYWDEIDRFKDENEQKLALDIDKHDRQKAEFKLIKNEQEEKKNHKLQLI